MPHVTAAVLAGGAGTRMGAGVPKQLLPLAGRPVLEHAVAAFQDAPEVDEVLVVMAPDHLHEAERITAPFPKVTAVLPGGSTRTDSSVAALRAVDARPGSDLLLLHDAARPLVARSTVAAAVAALEHAGAVGVAVPSSDTVVRVAPGADGAEAIAEVPPRAELRRMQTPQGFRLEVLRRAYAAALADPDLVATDDCGVVLRYLPGEPVHIVAGTEANIKVTHPGDVEVAEALLRREAGRGAGEGGR
ncbi:2-C-methyl-D-erythritol 4-phosphate cytidylyltransferase [Nocardiopsis sp. RSe5-2]|uniref:2-C-methyl-D-erythritol 4-phosphate cytidylyltransferase n=1 Tax=Nocardiopsis endophytica TaxID=3018445 RepID=A0ABT4U9Z9_9ACTN|nr:2-C-methyl-D-erythritol 4-phosphate cytidylyltransferase [Nocardiopsis endophytica]MDA2813790.1 2-C-methyl-D-erythritol 4-phosphate cytidylyltransferase [Nocardiopsis endophytica]